MKRQTAVVFRLLEHAWQREGCVLVDLKIEFGVNTKGEVVLADVIDNDSWRVWPNGDRRLQLDKQFYRDLPEVTDEALKELKKNYEKVADLTAHFVKSTKSTRVVIVMGSAADKDYSSKIAKEAERYGVGHVHLHVCSAHKSTAEALKLIAKYEDDGVPTVFVAVAGRSNGLGPVISGNTTHAVINAPPCGADWAAQDVWSSLRMPSGMLGNTARISRQPLGRLHYRVEVKSG
ncbi:multifunctional protein ADE2 [Aphelenchoides avenae]|nr:multifunctional protein ADE2 [Aphelenchus avenae]